MSLKTKIQDLIESASFLDVVNNNFTLIKTASFYKIPTKRISWTNLFKAVSAETVTIKSKAKITDMQNTFGFHRCSVIDIQGINTENCVYFSECFSCNAELNKLKQIIGEIDFSKSKDCFSINSVTHLCRLWCVCTGEAHALLLAL